MEHLDRVDAAGVLADRDTRSLTLYGRSTISITPAAKFDSEPCSARPIARPAAPSTATTAVVLTPTVSSAAITTTTNSAAYATSPRNLRSESRLAALHHAGRARASIARETQRPIDEDRERDQQLASRTGAGSSSANARTSSSRDRHRTARRGPRRRIQRLREVIEEQRQPRRQVLRARDRPRGRRSGACATRAARARACPAARSSAIMKSDEQRDAAAGERDVAHRAVVVAREPRRPAELVRSASPLTSVHGLVARRRREQHVVVLVELLDRLRRAALREVRRRRARARAASCTAGARSASTPASARSAPRRRSRPRSDRRAGRSPRARR